jgi:acyl-coenzyme A thioesterase PaaI-like protein
MTTILELAQKMQRGEVPPPPIGRLLGFVLKVIEPGHAVFEMEAYERHHNPWCRSIGPSSRRALSSWPIPLPASTMPN